MKTAIAVGALFGFLLGLAATAQEPYEQTFPRDIPSPEGFRANRTSYSAVMEVLRSSRPEVSREQLDQLRKLQLESIWDALGDYRENFVRGFISTQPGQRLVGRALTMRFLPARPDLVRALDKLAGEGDWDRRYYARAAEEARPDDVVVAELGGVDGNQLFGDIGALGIKLRGVAGVVIDGGSRDLAELGAESFRDFPVFARFFDVHRSSWLGVEWNTPIRVGNVTVLPGDIVVAEEEGILFVPPELVETIIRDANQRTVTEDYQREVLRTKTYRFRDVYPLAPALEAEFEAKRRTQPKN